MLKLLFCFFLFQSMCFSQYNPDYSNYMCGETEKPFFRIIPNGDGTKTVLSGRKYSHYFKFEVPNQSGKKRVFVIGESAASILYNNREEYFFDPGLLKDIQLLDFGMGGYDADRVMGVFREAVRLEPDEIVVMSGNNGWFFEGCSSPVHALKRASMNFRRAYTGYFSDEKEHLAAYSAARQKSVLREMANLAREKKIKLFFTVLPVNYFFPPSGNLPVDCDFFRAYEAYSAGKYAEAVPLFRDLLAKRSDDSFVCYYAARTFYALGKYEEAEKYFKAAVRYDPRLDRTTDLVEETIRKAASEKGVGLIDLAAYFRSLSGKGLTDEKYFADGVHWLKKYNPGVQAFMLAAAVPEISGKMRKPEPKKTEEDRNNFLRYAVSYINEKQGGFNERALYMLERFLEISKLKPEEFTREKVKSFLKDNIWLDLTGTVDHWWCGFLSHLAEAESRRGDGKGSAIILEKAKRECSGLTKKPALTCGCTASAFISKKPEKKSDFFSRLESKNYSDKGVGKLVAGDIKGGIELLKKAVARDPGNFEACISLCSALYGQGDYAGALQACDNAVSAAGGAFGKYPPEIGFGFLRDAFAQRALVREKTGDETGAEKDRHAARKCASEVKKSAE